MKRFIELVTCAGLVLAALFPVAALVWAGSQQATPLPVAQHATTSTTSSTTTSTTTATTSTIAPTTTSSSTVPATTAPAPARARALAVVGPDWDYLADCESGTWDKHRRPIHGTARWDDHDGRYEGGVHFAPSTWDDNRPTGYPEAAYLATREQQIVVARIVLHRQGPGAWPTCSRKVGMR